MAGKPAAPIATSPAPDESPVLDLNGTRGRIISGAMEAFDRVGVADCTVEDILRAAGVSRGTFYQYFRNKEDVLATVFQFSVRLLVERVREAISEVGEPFEKIERAVDIYLAMQMEQGRLIHGMLVEAMRPGSRMAELREWALDMMVSFIHDTVVAAQQRYVDPLVYRGLLVVVEGLVLHMRENPRFSAEQAAHIRRVVIPIIERTMALPGDQVPELPASASDGPDLP
jgi:AcrR family transcriptional regulator